MTDLEKLIRDRQDQLRGRPHHWTDTLRDWRYRIHSTTRIAVALTLGLLLILLCIR